MGPVAGWPNDGITRAGHVVYGLFMSQMVCPEDARSMLQLRKTAKSVETDALHGSTSRLMGLH